VVRRRGTRPGRLARPRRLSTGAGRVRRWRRRGRGRERRQLRVSSVVIRERSAITLGRMRRPDDVRITGRGKHRCRTRPDGGAGGSVPGGRNSAGEPAATEETMDANGNVDRLAASWRYPVKSMAGEALQAAAAAG